MSEPAIVKDIDIALDLTNLAKLNLDLALRILGLDAEVGNTGLVKRDLEPTALIIWLLKLLLYCRLDKLNIIWCYGAAQKRLFCLQLEEELMLGRLECLHRRYEFFDGALPGVADQLHPQDLGSVQKAQKYVGGLAIYEFSGYFCQTCL